jgi:hypothetical protein
MHALQGALTFEEVLGAALALEKLALSHHFQAWLLSANGL